MHQYFIKTPWMVRRFFSSYTWRIPTTEKAVYLSFDDGPHPIITPWVLDQLKQCQARASFFCVGNNVEQYPQIYQSILEQGHAVGNHTYHHMNGWEVSVSDYLEDIARAATLIKTDLFRPPYGRIRSKQAEQIKTVIGANAQIIMWDVLSADFDKTISKEACLDNVLSHLEAGSIIVFHDSEKAFPHLEYVLPKVLAHLQQEGYICRKLEYIR
ncbi:MAG: polysaccharide deacetylase family protein [Flavisolibacter sp.]